MAAVREVNDAVVDSCCSADEKSLSGQRKEDLVNLLKVVVTVLL